MAIDKANKKPTNEPDDDLMDDSVPFGAHELTDEEIADHDLGLEAGLAGKPNDDTKSAAWQRGWGCAGIKDLGERNIAKFSVCPTL